MKDVPKRRKVLTADDIAEEAIRGKDVSKYFTGEPRMMPGTAKASDPLHGVTLEAMLTQLVARHGWPKMGEAIDIRCFTQDPSIQSSLKFLRKTPWAREKVEELYLTGKVLKRRR